ncbi:hypothetical protein P3T21_007171 [Paraburkholderia sp. GAS334]
MMLSSKTWPRPSLTFRAEPPLIPFFLTSHLQQNFSAHLGMDDRSTDFLESVFRRDGT